MVDLHMESEFVTYCEAVIRIGHAVIKHPEELKRQVESEFYNKKDIAIPSIDSHALEPRTWNFRAEHHGFTPENSLDAKSIIQLTSDISPGPSDSEVQFHHSRLSKLPPISELEKKECSFNRFLGFNTFTLMDKRTGPELAAKLEKEITSWINSGITFLEL